MCHNCKCSKHLTLLICQCVTVTDKYGRTVSGTLQHVQFFIAHQVWELPHLHLFYLQICLHLALDLGKYKSFRPESYCFQVGVLVVCVQNWIKFGGDSILISLGDNR